MTWLRDKLPRVFGVKEPLESEKLDALRARAICMEHIAKHAWLMYHEEATKHIEGILRGEKKQ